MESFYLLVNIPAMSTLFSLKIYHGALDEDINEYKDNLEMAPIVKML